MNVTVFVPCLVDQFYPSVARATIRLLEWTGLKVSFRPEQTCCGQPAFNDGYWDAAIATARRTVELMEDAQYVVVPSGSCTAMMRHFYPRLLGTTIGDQRCQSFAARVVELSQFLVDVVGLTEIPGSWTGTVTYHDSCHLLRELGVREQPRKLLLAKPGLELRDLESADFCCGFGGAFSVKMAHISEAILKEKLDKIEATGADTVTAGDAGCLMHISGGLARRGSRVKAVHIAELLAQGI